jgi:hypothetical protein
MDPIVALGATRSMEIQALVGEWRTVTAQERYWSDYKSQIRKNNRFQLRFRNCEYRIQNRISESGEGITYEIFVLGVVKGRPLNGKGM